MRKNQKTLQELNLEDDFLFAKVMSDKEICKRVIEKILHIKIKEIKMPEEQKVFDPFGKGRHRYTFENRCLEDLAIGLNDETTKVFLNTSGILNDVDEEMIEFLKYVEQSTDEVAFNSKSDLVKAINQKVNHVKHDKAMEVQYMTLLERDRINFEEGRTEEKEKNAKALLDVLDDETISKKLDMPIERVKELRMNSMQ